MSDHALDDPSPDTERTESVSLPVGTPRYEFLGEIAHGGMGTVFAAHDTALNRDVAVKVLHSRFKVGTAPARRFVEEAKITGQLQHPGIPPIHDLGTLPDGRPFLAMKLIKGDTLDALLKARPDPAHDRGRFVAIFEQMCQALGYAHAHKVIHRDLKPANVMVGAFGEVQVMDWGLAKVLASRERERPEATADDAEMTADLSEIDSDRGDDSATRAGSVLGTPAYMPREQAIGAIDQIDQQSDVFGLGAILCAILTGKPPYVGADSESTRQLAALGKLDDAVTRLDACGAEPELVALCKRCLSVEKSARPADAGEVAGIVASLRAAADERARLAELERVKAEESRKRRRVQFTLAAVALVMVAGGTAVGWWLDHQATARKIETANRERDEQERQARNGDAVAAALDRCEEALRADNTATAALMLAQAKKQAAEGGTDHLAARLEQCAADVEVLQELDAIERFRWTWLRDTGKRPAATDLSPRWRAALGRLGIDLGRTPVGDAAAIVQRSNVRDRLLTALEQLLQVEPQADVRAVLRAVDSDAYREAVRDAVLAGDRAAIAKLATRPDATTQPAWFAAVLGGHEAVPVDSRREMLKAANRRHPSALTLLMTMGRTYRFNQRDGAVERLRWFQAALAVHPSKECFNILGDALADTGDVNGAIDCFQAVLQLDPVDPAAHAYMGRARFDLGDYDGAIRWEKEAIRLNPNVAWFHDNLAASLIRKSDWDGAILESREAIRLDPKSAIAYDNLGFALSRKGDRDGAIASYREAIRLDPEDTRCHFMLGELLSWNENMDEALAAYREVIRLAPKNNTAYQDTAYQRVGSLLFKKGDVDGAITAFRETIRLWPTHPGIYGRLAEALHAGGDVYGAIVYYRQQIQRGGLYDLQDHRLARILAAGPDGIRDEMQAVVMAIRLCEQLRWKSAPHIDTLALACAAAGDFDRAVEYQRLALTFPDFEKSSGPSARKRLQLARLRRVLDSSLAITHPVRSDRHLPGQCIVRDRVIRNRFEPFFIRHDLPVEIASLSQGKHQRQARIAGVRE